MKKLSLTVLALAAFSAVFGQFINPNGAYQEFNYPTGSMNLSGRTVHASNYEMVGNPTSAPNSNLYVYSWSGQGTGFTPTDQSGIAWIRRNPSNAILGMGTITGLPSTRMQDIDVAMYDDGNYSYIIAAYYLTDPTGVNAGHYINIYKWVGGIPTAVGPAIQLSNSATYGRISIDAHDKSEVAIVWQDGAEIKVLTAQATAGSSNGLTFGQVLNVYNAQNGILPDVAFQHKGTDLEHVYVRIVYVDNQGNFVVSYERFLQLYIETNPGINFQTDDVQPAPAYYTSATSNTTYVASSLNIDCPDHYNYTNWAYIYSDGNTNIYGRILNQAASSLPGNYNLTNMPGLGLINTSVNYINTSIGYNRLGNAIYFGWYTFYQNKGYVALQLNENGSLVVPGYMIVTNTNSPSASPTMSFSKVSSDIATPLNTLFVSYAMQLGGGVYSLSTKLIPFSAGSFRPGSAATETTPVDNIAEAFPNPYSKTFSLSINNDDGKTDYSVLISDISGKEILHFNGILQKINGNLENISEGLPAGLYFLNIKTDSWSKTIKVVKN